VIVPSSLSRTPSSNRSENPNNSATARVSG
jgi:hypothetical protein